MAGTTVIGVQGVPTGVVEILKGRAEAGGLSLAAYIRGLLPEEASRPELAEVMARMAEDEPIHYTEDDLRAFKADHR